MYSWVPDSVKELNTNATGFPMVAPLVFHRQELTALPPFAVVN